MIHSKWLKPERVSPLLIIPLNSIKSQFLLIKPWSNNVKSKAFDRLCRLPPIPSEGPGPQHMMKNQQSVYHHCYPPVCSKMWLAGKFPINWCLNGNIIHKWEIFIAMFDYNSVSCALFFLRIHFVRMENWIFFLKKLHTWNPDLKGSHQVSLHQMLGPPSKSHLQYSKKLASPWPPFQGQHLNCFVANLYNMGLLQNSGPQNPNASNHSILLARIASFFLNWMMGHLQENRKTLYSSGENHAKTLMETIDFPLNQSMEREWSSHSVADIPIISDCIPLPMIWARNKYHMYHGLFIIHKSHRNFDVNPGDVSNLIHPQNAHSVSPPRSLRLKPWKKCAKLAKMRHVGARPITTLGNVGLMVVKWDLMLVSWDLMLISWDLMLVSWDLMLVSWDLMLVSWDLMLVSRDLMLVSWDLMLVSWDLMLVSWDLMLVSWDLMLVSWDLMLVSRDLMLVSRDLMLVSWDLMLVSWDLMGTRLQKDVENPWWHLLGKWSKHAG